MRFIKMHGAGNDYVYVNCFDQAPPANPAELARQVSNRHFGIGADGLILVCPSKDAVAQMRMFNADGSEAEMCGNGIRCVAKLLYDANICRTDSMVIDTGAGPLTLQLVLTRNRVDHVRVDMGPPILESAKIPTTLTGKPIVEVPLEVNGEHVRVTCVSMGNPHCVVFVDEVTDAWVLERGPQIEIDAHFPARVNVEFVEVLSRSELRQRTWERGSGETLACGTGASAVCVAGVLSNRAERQVLIHLAGGDLELEWNASDNHVYMTGPAEELFRGEWLRELPK